MNNKELADELASTSGDIVDVQYLEKEEKFIIFSWHERLYPRTMAVLAEHDLHASPQASAMIQYSHKEIKNDHDEPFEATFTAFK